jgi:hypothetical protein
MHNVRVHAQRAPTVIITARGGFIRTECSRWEPAGSRAAAQLAFLLQSILMAHFGHATLAWLLEMLTTQ